MERDTRECSCTPADSKLSVGEGLVRPKKRVGYRGQDMGSPELTGQSDCCWELHVARL